MDWEQNSSSSESQDGNEDPAPPSTRPEGQRQPTLTRGQYSSLLRNQGPLEEVIDVDSVPDDVASIPLPGEVHPLASTSTRREVPRRHNVYEPQPSTSWSPPRVRHNSWRFDARVQSERTQHRSPIDVGDFIICSMQILYRGGTSEMEGNFDFNRRGREETSTDSDDVASIPLPSRQRTNAPRGAPHRHNVPDAQPSTSGCHTGQSERSDSTECLALQSREKKRNWRRRRLIVYSRRWHAAQINKSSSEHVECSVCLLWMVPPVYECRRGHIICARCFRVRYACDRCSSKLRTSRVSRGMEPTSSKTQYLDDIDDDSRSPWEEFADQIELYFLQNNRARRTNNPGAYCPAPCCSRATPLTRATLFHIFQSSGHSPNETLVLKTGREEKHSVRSRGNTTVICTTERHEHWVLSLFQEYFHLNILVSEMDSLDWGIYIYVIYIGPRELAQNFTYKVSVGSKFEKTSMVYPQPFYNDMETTNLPEHRDCYYLALDHLPGFCKRSSRNGPQNGRHPTPVAAAKFNIEILRNEQ